VIEPVQRIIERQARVAAQAEDVLDAVLLEHADERFRAGDLHGYCFAFSASFTLGITSSAMRLIERLASCGSAQSSPA
jgi:hypothetical protein